jgi:hypothetical protein
VSHFHGPRLLRLFHRDLLQQGRKIWIATLALGGIGLIVYLLDLDPRSVEKPELYRVWFPAALIGGGLIFTSTIFVDLHDSLQRSYFLTFPCSNLERFLSRYLLSGPLYYVYALIVYAVVDTLAAVLGNTALGTSAAAVAPFYRGMLELTLAYFGLHALMFCGAIYFRSHALIKTLLSVLTIWLGLVLTQLLALRIFYWDYFTTLLPVESAVPMPALVPGPAMKVAAGLLLSLWVLFIAYQCLREQELQREL